MVCFDHFPILISQLILHTHEDHDTENAEEPPHCCRAARSPIKLIIRTVQFGSAEPFFQSYAVFIEPIEQSWRSAIRRPRGEEDL
jgi:hypothetical protein